MIRQDHGTTELEPGDKEKLLRLSDELAEHTIALRREIHQNPELAFEEFETAGLVMRELERIGIPYEESPARPGIVANIDSGKPGRLLMLRADMDALPIGETADVPFISRNKGVMHACGHDVHTANLLAVGEILNRMKESWSGRVRLVFQPAEERGGGGRRMIEAGLMDELPDACMALHVTSDQGGCFYVGVGPVTAFSDRCEMVVHGKAAHSSEPQEGVDAVYIASSIIVALNTLVSKSLCPMEHSTLNMGRISGGEALNVITDRVEISGMMRNAKAHTRGVMMEKIRTLSEGIASAMGGSCEVQFEEGYASVFNDETLAKQVISVIENNGKTLYKDIPVPDPYPEIITGNILRLASEDFGFFSQKAPSCYIMMGTGEGAPVHNPEFKVDESYIKLATRTMAAFALAYLS